VNLCLLAALLGILLPVKMGIEYLDAGVILPYSLAGLAPLSGAAAEAFALRAPDPRRRVAALAAGGLAYALAIIGLGVAIVSARAGYGLLLPSRLVASSAVLLSVTANAYMAAAAGVMSRRGYRTEEIKSRLRALLGVALVLWIARPWIVPAAVGEWLAPWSTSRGIAGGTLALSALLAAGAEIQLRRMLR
jgi:hypothetical protein